MIAFRGGTHVLFAVSVGLGVALPLEGYPLLLVGSVLPDIDHPYSPIGRRFYSPIWGRHRTFTHSLLFAALASVISPSLGLGCLTHIFLDLFNPSGCPLLFPLPKRFRFARIRTGGVGEKLIFYFLIVLFVISIVTPA